jgi:hypothetical protein
MTLGTIQTNKEISLDHLILRTHVTKNIVVQDIVIGRGGEDVELKSMICFSLVSKDEKASPKD